MLLYLLHQINFRLIAEALKRDYPSKFASKTMVRNENEFVKMQSLVAAYDAGKVIIEKSRGEVSLMETVAHYWPKSFSSNANWPKHTLVLWLICQHR